MSANTGGFVIKDGSLSIASHDVSNAIGKMRLVPDTPVQTFNTIVPDGTLQDVGNTAWTFQVTAIQDWGANGIASLLNTNAGDTVACVMAPKNGAGKNATFNIVAMPVDFGGDSGSYNSFDATFPVVGSPVFGDESS